MIGARDLSIPTLIFDEVDAGIGGAVAEVVGRQLRALGDRTQVLCVTHLPQVAAQAHQHLQITKQKSRETTRTGIELLDESRRVREIARMLGGIELTDQSLAHAREMIERGQSDAG
jgi:DNA repair protein RecN (Recombination protein N)